MDRNAHVKDYLSYYVDFPRAPGFAVLLNGPWGIGKTRLVDDFTSGFKDRGLRHVRVSLYGLTSLAEIDDALLRALYPLLDNRYADWAGRAGKVAMKFFRVDTEVKANDFFDKKKIDVFVFDDLERCGIPINAVLGYINEIVEHDQRKVIIIANELEIKENSEYQRIREKLIGKTFDIRSVFESALISFLNSISHEDTKAFLKSKDKVIAAVFDQSELNNLRVLQQAMWDFERFYASLNAKYKANDAAMTELLSVLFAISFEIKAARLKADDLSRRQSALVTAMMRSSRDASAPPPPFSQAQSRYPEIKLDTTTLSDETIVNLLIKGIIDREQIARELDVSHYFQRAEDEPAWRTLWHLHGRTEEQFNIALTEVDRAFAEREFIKTGEILHVFGMRLWLARIGVLTKKLDEIVKECEAYVDDLYAAQKLELSINRHSALGLRFDGYGGLGIHDNDTPEYRSLVSYLKEAQRKAEVDTRPAIGADVLAIVKNEPDRLYRTINITADGGSAFYNVPILAAIKPDEFVDAWLSLHPQDQQTVAVALKGRYDHGQLARELSDEKPWAEQVRALLLARTQQMSPISRYRVQQNLAYSLDPVLDAPEPRSDPSAANEDADIDKLDV